MSMNTPSDQSKGHPPHPAAGNFETEAIHIQSARSHQRENSVPIFATSGFVFDSPEQAAALFRGDIEGNIYSRYSNPNTDEFVAKLCALEGCVDGIATASGMAAMFASLAAFLNSGDHVVASRHLFGPTIQIVGQTLPRWGIGSSFVTGRDTASFARVLRPNTKIIFIETPSNPCLEIFDIAALAELARARNILLIVDNCFATPWLQQPARLGAHIVTHSATKFIDGQGRVLGGAVLGEAEQIAQVRQFARQTGPSLSAFDAWLLSKSLETLAVRMERHCANALAVATALEQHPNVEGVRYPYLPSHPQHALARAQMRHGGGIVLFEPRGGYDAAIRLMKSLRLVRLSANLGDTRTIVTHPASTTHSSLTPDQQAVIGIRPGMLRVSVGLEHSADIIADLTAAL